MFEFASNSFFIGLRKVITFQGKTDSKIPSNILNEVIDLYIYKHNCTLHFC